MRKRGQKPRSTNCYATNPFSHYGAKILTEILQNWRFYYTQDDGDVTKSQWRRAFFVLAAVFGVATILCALLMAVRAPSNNPDKVTWLTPLIYTYVILYSVGVMIALASLYHLCAKRFTAQGRPKALAVIFPFAIFLAGSLAFVAPTLADFLPDFVIWLGVLLAVAAGVWQIYLAGFGKGADKISATTEPSS